MSVMEWEGVRTDNFVIVLYTCQITTDYHSLEGPVVGRNASRHQHAPTTEFRTLHQRNCPSDVNKNADGHHCYQDETRTSL